MVFVYLFIHPHNFPPHRYVGGEEVVAFPPLAFIYARGRSPIGTIRGYIGEYYYYVKLFIQH